MSDIQEIDEIIPKKAEVAGSSPLPYSVPSPYAPPQSSVPASHASAEQPENSPSPAPPAAKHTANPPRKGLMGLLVTIGAILAKWWGVALGLLFKLKGLLIAFKLLTVGKLLLTGGTMLLSMFFWSYSFGWPMAVGIVLSIFIHECGHALAAKQLGHKLGIMLFVPFMGAVVTSRGGRSVVEGAYVGIMGPVAGTLSGIVCAGLFFMTGNPFWLPLAAFIFLINLFNLIPTAPLDGGWIAPLFSPKLLLPGVVLLLLFFWRNPMVWGLAVLSLPRIIHAWKHGNESEYYKASSQDRWKYGLAYLGLVAFLAASQLACMDYLNSHYTLPQSHRVPRQKA